MESRYDKLMSMYLKSVYLEMDEAARDRPSEAVIYACQISKRAIHDELTKKHAWRFR